MILKTTICALFALSFLGCAIPNMEYSRPTNMTIAVAPENKSLIYFIRPQEQGHLINAAVYDGDEFIGFVPYKQKLPYYAAPGQHRFMVVSETADFMDADLLPNKTYYVQVKLIWSERFLLLPITKYELTTNEVTTWIEEARLIENKPGAYDWANENRQSVLEKKDVYLKQWLKKDKSEQPNIKPDVSLNVVAENNDITLGTMKPEELHVAEKEIPAVQTRSRPGKEAEFYVAVFGGSARVADSQVTATAQDQDCGFWGGCSPPVTASKNVTYEKGDVAGLRIGMWGGNEFKYLGFAYEVSTIKAPSLNSSMALSYESYTFMPMLRIPFLETESMPGGRLNFYGGIGFSSVEGHMDISIPGLPRTVSGDAEGNGSIFLIGASLKFSRVSLFVEKRTTDASLSFDAEHADGWGNRDSGEADYSTKETVVGVACRF
jgi:hypothetical protein